MHVIPRYFCVLLCVLINVYIVLFYRYIFFAFAYIESWSSYSFATRLFHSTLFLRFLASCTGSSTDVEWDWQTMAHRAVCDTPLFTPRHGSAFRLRWQAWAVVTEPKAYRPKILTAWRSTKQVTRAWGSAPLCEERGSLSLQWYRGRLVLLSPPRYTAESTHTSPNTRTWLSSG